MPVCFKSCPCAFSRALVLSRSWTVHAHPAACSRLANFAKQACPCSFPMQWYEITGCRGKITYHIVTRQDTEASLNRNRVSDYVICFKRQWKENPIHAQYLRMTSSHPESISVQDSWIIETQWSVKKFAFCDIGPDGT